MITAVLSNFGLAAWGAVVVVAVTAIITAAMAIRLRSAGRPVLEPTARVATVGSVFLILAATASPYSWPPERYGLGDLALAVGAGGLRHIDQAVTAPTSLAALLLYANVALYVPVALFATIGWPARSATILGAALLLSIGVEATQYIALERVAATDDVLLNMAGALIGFVLGLVLRRSRGPRGRGAVELGGGRDPG